MKEKISYMSDKFEQAGFTFSDLQKRQFYTFYNMLIDKNKVMNLKSCHRFRSASEDH